MVFLLQYIFLEKVCKLVFSATFSHLVVGVPVYFSVLSDTCIRFQHFLEVVSNSKVRVFGCSGIKNPFQLIGGTSCDPAKVIQRALDRLGEGNYHFATWNCESYVNWVYYNIGIRWFSGMLIFITLVPFQVYIVALNLWKRHLVQL